MSENHQDWKRQILMINKLQLDKTYYSQDAKLLLEFVRGMQSLLLGWLQHSQVPVWRDICQKQKREKNLNIIQENHPKVEIFNFHSEWLSPCVRWWRRHESRRQTGDHPTIMPVIIATHQMLISRIVWRQQTSNFMTICTNDIINNVDGSHLQFLVSISQLPSLARTAHHDLGHVSESLLLSSWMKHIIE